MVIQIFLHVLVAYFCVRALDTVNAIFDNRIHLDSTDVFLMGSYAYTMIYWIVPNLN